MLQRLSLIFALTIGLALSSAYAQGEEAGRMLVIYDSSNSMWGELADKSRKYEAGRSALSALLETDLAGREIGFRAYGHRRKTDCRDSELIVPFSGSEAARVQINKAAQAIRPTGKTPITYSLREGLTDFDGRPGDILLISDGIETCDIDPCELMREWEASNVNIRVHVVGVGLTEFERAAMACIADTSGGKYFDADSADGFAQALTEASVAIEAPRGEPDPVAPVGRYALIIKGADETGRSFRLIGAHSKGDVDLGVITSSGRYGVDGPGDYMVEAGVRLQDGTAYMPVKMPVSVTEMGDTIVNILVTRPAIVSATFIENGEEHRGANVTAYQDGKEVFKFRAFDEALARPGDYEFRAEPNADNKLSLSDTLVEGEHTKLVFDLTKTIKFYVRFILPNGDTFKRGSELWRDGERLYKVFGSNNPTIVRPGVYELRSDDQNLPLTPVEIDIKKDGETIEVPVDAGWVKISYAPSEFDYVGKPNRAWLESLDRGNSKYARLDTPIPAKPGRYRANPQTSKGFFDPVDIEIASNQTVDVVFQPKPLGEIIVIYAPSGNWPKEPDRASVYPLADQAMLNGFMRPGVAKKFLPGRYQVKGGATGSDAAPQEIIVTAHETITVTLKHKLDE